MFQAPKIAEKKSGPSQDYKGNPKKPRLDATKRKQFKNKI